MDAFYPLTTDLAAKLRQCNLTAAEWRLWSYLATLDPFGDRYLSINIPDVLEECSLSNATFYRALAKFEDHGLFITQPMKIAIRNLQGAKKLLPKDSLKNEKAFSEMRGFSQKRENQQPEPIQAEASRSPHTLKTNQTNRSLSHSDDLEREILEVDEDQLLEFATNKVKQSSEIQRPRAYAKKCIKDDRDYWIAEFRKWRQLQEQINVPISPPPSTVFEVETIDQQRERLIRMWNFVPCRPGIRNAIETQPDLKLQIVEGELREV